MSSRGFKPQKITDDASNRQTTSIPTSTIPYLPDNVIEKILSSLPINLAAQATTVSKQWSSLWPSFSFIDLDESSYSEPQRFRIFLRHSLRRCRNQKVLDKLRIRANLGYGFSLVRDWIDFAMERYLKELYLQDLAINICMKAYLISHNVLTSKSLTSLSLENVTLYAGLNGPVSLPSLKTMSLIYVTFLDDVDSRDIPAFPSLVSGCPCLEYLSVDGCDLGYSTFDLDICSHSLKSLEVLHCHSTTVSITAKNLESFTFYSDCICDYHKIMYLWECDSLKHVDISCKRVRQILLHNCIGTIENSFYTPYLEIFVFSGYLKTKVHFVEAPSKLVNSIIRVSESFNVWETSRPIEYYSAMRDFLESFDCSKKVKIHLGEAEDVIIPEHCRREWSPPLPSIRQLQLYFSVPWENTEYYLRSPLLWMAPSAEILPFLHNDDDGDNYKDMVADGIDNFHHDDDNEDGDNDNNED